MILSVTLIGQATISVAKAAGFAGPARAPVAVLIGSSSHGLAPSCRSPRGHSPLRALAPRELGALTRPPLAGEPNSIPAAVGERSTLRWFASTRIVVPALAGGGSPPPKGGTTNRAHRPGQLLFPDRVRYPARCRCRREANVLFWLFAESLARSSAGDRRSRRTPRRSECCVTWPPGGRAGRTSPVIT